MIRIRARAASFTTGCITGIIIAGQLFLHSRGGVSVAAELPGRGPDTVDGAAHEKVRNRGTLAIGLVEITQCQEGM